MHKIAIFGLFAMALLISIPAQAQTAREYPWCARYDWTTYNCGFVSLNQCLATTSGVGGRCELNPRYAGEARAKKRYRN